MKAIGFVIDKAPKGGYRLCRVVNGLTTDAPLATEIVAYCSTLVEAQEIEHAEKAELFQERAWYPQQPYRAQGLPPPPPASPEHEAMPNVVERFAQDGGVPGRWMNGYEGGVRSVIPALFLTALWASTYLRPMVA